MTDITSITITILGITVIITIIAGIRTLKTIDELRKDIISLERRIHYLEEESKYL